MSTSSRLIGKRALVTGGSKRVGRAIVLALAEAGVSIIVHYNTSPDEAEKTATDVHASGVPAWTIQGDLSNPQETEELFSRVRSLAGPVDFLINSASIFPVNHLTDFTAADLTANIQINTMAPLQLARAFAAQGRTGCVINLLDCRIVDYDSEHIAYHLSKRMLYSLTRLMALEFAPAIRVNAVAPGLILPPRGKDKSYLKELASANPLHSIGNPEQVAEAIIYLLQAEYVTGQVIYVDGGRNLKGSIYG